MNTITILTENGRVVKLMRRIADTDRPPEAIPREVPSALCGTAWAAEDVESITWANQKKRREQPEEPARLHNAEQLLTRKRDRGSRRRKLLKLGGIAAMVLFSVLAAVFLGQAKLLDACIAIVLDLASVYCIVEFTDYG